MMIYIIRHGKAQDHSPSGLDRDRKLKKKGHRQGEAIGEYLRDTESVPEIVVSSPYVRARETALAICDALEKESQIDDRLVADRSLSDMLDVLIDLQGAKSVAIVSHNPNCSRMVSLLTQGISATPNGHRTGEVVAIEVDGDELVGQGRLIDRFRLESD